MDVDQTITSSLALVTKVAINLNDIKYHYDNYGGGSTSSSSKLYVDLTNTFSALGEFIQTLGILINQ